MGSRMECLCGDLVYTNHFYKLIKDMDYDTLEDPVDYDKLSDLFWNKGVTAYRCSSCGRLIVEWEDDGGPTFYLPEGKPAELPRIEAALAGVGRHEAQGLQGPEDKAEAGRAESDKQDDPRLKQLEAMAEAAYGEMYDSSYPAGPYSEAKEAFCEAIARARELGRREDVERLEKRLQHVKDVFRHQFV